jgi:hypothetical protein
MPGRDTPFFKLREALSAGGCALCRLADEAATAYIESALYEGMTDPPTRNRLRAAGGLCRRHAWQMTRMRASALGTALVYRDVLADLIAGLESPSAGRGRQPDPLPQPHQPCPACSTGDDVAERSGDVLRAHLGDAEINAAYRAAGGLCLPHLRAVLARARGTEGETLRQWQLAIYKDLRGELDELIRKHDYRFRQEPVGSEADAWLRAVARLVGEPDPDSQ